MARSSKKAPSSQEIVRHGICHMCTDCCPTKVHIQGGRVVRVDMMDKRLSDTCPRWKAQLDFVYHPDRLKYPLKRVGRRGTGSFTRISWEEALDTIASKFQEVKTEYGPESVVFWVANTKEPRPFLHRLTHAFGSPNYCTESSNCFTAGWLATIVTYGEDYGSLYDQGRTADPASKCKLVWGTTIQNSAPDVWEEHVKARRKGLKLIVVDPRRTFLASMADVHLQLRPGTDGALALGLMNVIINEDLYDKDFVERWTVGFDELKKLVQQYPPERVERITWVPAAKVKEAAILYATEKPGKLGMSGSSTLHCSNGVQNHRAIILLPAITGNFDVPGGSGWVPSRWASGHLPTNDITLHERVESMPQGLGADRFPLWTRLLREMQSNVLADQIESSSPYPIKALFGAGLDIMFFPNSERFVENLKKLDMIVVSDYFHTPSTLYADIVLPIASWLERQILVVRPEGHVSLIEPAIEPVGESWPEWKVVSELAKRWGLGHEFWDGDFERCVNHILEPSGISAEQLKEHPEGITYPVASRPERYYKEVGFRTPSGKVEIASSILQQYGYETLPVYKEPMESPVSRADAASAYPLVLTSGARRLPFTHSMHRNIPRLREMIPEPLVEMSPPDAEARGIRSGDEVVVTSPRGTIRLKANVTVSIVPGVVQIPHHWPGQANVNILTDDQNLDPISGFASYKSGLCEVSKEGSGKEGG